MFKYLVLTEPTEVGDERALLRAMAARAARTSASPEWSSDQLAMIDTLVSRGAQRKGFNAMTPERFMQFCEAWRRYACHSRQSGREAEHL
jgi:hypothetical protein